jgi:hypothetical protein
MRGRRSASRIGSGNRWRGASSSPRLTAVCRLTRCPVKTKTDRSAEERDQLLLAHDAVYKQLLNITRLQANKAVIPGWPYLLGWASRSRAKEGWSTSGGPSGS